MKRGVETRRLLRKNCRELRHSSAALQDGYVLIRKFFLRITETRPCYARHLQKTPFSDAERGFAILDITIIVADLRDRGYDAELLVEEDDDVPLAKQTFSLMIWPGLP